MLGYERRRPIPPLMNPSSESLQSQQRNKKGKKPNSIITAGYNCSDQNALKERIVFRDCDSQKDRYISVM